MINADQQPLEAGARTAEERVAPALQDDIKVDVCIVGAGRAGVTAHDLTCPRGTF